MTPLKTAVTKKLRRKYLEGSVSFKSKWNENQCNYHCLFGGLKERNTKTVFVKTK